MKLLLVMLVTFSTFAQITKVFDTRNDQYITYESFLKSLPAQGVIVLGEFHNDQAIQTGQAQIIEDHVKATNSQGDFGVMWEFLNFTDQDKITREFEKLKAGEITAGNFVELTAGEQNLTYTPIFATTKDLGGDVFGLNLPRDIKKKVMDGGVDSVDPMYISDNFRLGSQKYLERFKAAMGGHAPDDLVMKYFLAQSLTDSVMSFHTFLNHRNLSFIVAGSFHTDFFDGTVLMLKELTSDSVVSLKMINESSLSMEELKVYTQRDLDYGHYADYIILTK